MVPLLDVLKASRIEIENDPMNIKPLPPYAKGLRDLLLDFDGIVPLNKKLELEPLYKNDKKSIDTKSPLPQAIPATLYRDAKYGKHIEIWDLAAELRDKVKELGKPLKEDPWNSLISNFVFDSINKQTSDQVYPAMDQLCWGSNELFTNAVSVRRQLSDGEDHQPKPDYWVGLKLYNDEQLCRLKGLERTDKGIEYFRPECLEKINKDHGDAFVCQPVKTEEYKAFPWMVIELKKQSGDESECLRQAANASHMCLVLCEKLVTSIARNVSPISVVAFTSVGPEAKVFITYSSEDPDGKYYRMSCIWSGHIQNILHAVQLRRIVDKLMFWALRIFKPWITECLDGLYKKETNKCDQISSDLKADREVSGWVPSTSRTLPGQTFPSSKVDHGLFGTGFDQISSDLKADRGVFGLSPSTSGTLPGPNFPSSKADHGLFGTGFDQISPDLKADRGLFGPGASQSKTSRLGRSDESDTDRIKSDSLQPETARPSAYNLFSTRRSKSGSPKPETARFGTGRNKPSPSECESRPQGGRAKSATELSYQFYSCPPYAVNPGSSQDSIISTKISTNQEMNDLEHNDQEASDQEFSDQIINNENDKGEEASDHDSNDEEHNDEEASNQEFSDQEFSDHDSDDEEYNDEEASSQESSNQELSDHDSDDVEYYSDEASDPEASD